MLKFVLRFMSQIKVLLSDLRHIRFTFDYSTGESQHYYGLEGLTQNLVISLGSIALD